MKLKSLSGVGLACFMGLAFVAQAKEVVWSGGAGPAADGLYYWTNTANWVGGKLPVSGDVPVFGRTGVTSCRFSTAKADTGFKGLRFEGGDFVSVSGGYFYFHDNYNQAEIFVAAGATAVMTNTFAAYHGDNHDRIVKTGEGSFAANKFGGDVYYTDIEVRAGTLKCLSDMKAIGIGVRKDAVLATGAANVINGANLTLDAGSELAMGGQVKVKKLSGSGVVYDAGVGKKAGSWATLQVNPDAECVFSGKIWTCLYVNPSASAKFVLGNGEMLSTSYSVQGSRWLGFAPGVGTFSIASYGNCYQPDSGYPLHLEDTDGNPVTVIAHLRPDTSALSTTGKGNFYSRAQARSLVGSKIQHVGILGNKASDTLTLGDGTAANDFDFSTLAGLDAQGPVEIKNVGALTFDGKVSGTAAVTVRPASTFGNVALTGEGVFKPYSDLTMTAGLLLGAYTPINFLADNKTFTLKGGVVGRSPTLDATRTMSKIPTYEGIAFVGANNQTANVCVQGGELYLDAYNNTFPKSLSVTGGRLYVVKSQTAPAWATAANPATILLDGGDVIARFKGDTTDLTPFADTDGVVVQVGAKGTTLRDAGLLTTLWERKVLICRPLTAAAGTAGTFTQEGYVDFVHYYPHTLAGTFRSVGGLTRIAATSAVPADAPYFGTGDLVMENASLVLADRETTANPVQLATASGKKLAYGGAVALRLREDSASAAEQTIRIGSLSRGAGGALYLGNVSGDVGANGGSSVKVDAGVATDAVSGRVLQPVIGMAGGLPYFLGYDATKGFVRLANVASDFTGATKDTVVEYGCPKDGWTGFHSPVSVQALSVKQYSTLCFYKSLTLGDGTNPAVLILRRSSITSGAADAYLSFGTSEGVIMATEYGAGISLPITQANGLTIVGYPHFGNSADRAYVELGGANSYGGVTRIGGVRVNALNASCFSTGAVHVLGGERFGGRICFQKEGGVWNNAFKVAGWGAPKDIWGGRTHVGALEFSMNGTVAGAVELTALARLCASSGVTGTLAGTVSGDRLQVFDSQGVIRLTHANAYTGGTEVVAATLELACTDAAGTGAVELNDGTLRFVNTTPVTFTNDVTGVGTVVVAGTAPVTFSGAAFARLPFKTLTAGTVLDLATPANDVYAPYLTGATDLGGKTYAVAGVAGSGTVANGKLVVTGEINPGGVGAVGTLSFAAGALEASAATYVCEVSPAGADRLVLADDADLSDLALKVVRLGGVPGDNPIVLSASSVTGDFATVELPRRSWNIEKGTDAVKLSCHPGMLMLLR